jgi:hypothetical protein
MLLVAKPQSLTTLKRRRKMKMMMAKTVFWMGLLLMLVGQGSSRLLAVGTGIPPTFEGPISVA